MSLKAAPKSSTNSTTPQVIYNPIESVTKIYEGWLDKYRSANIGFGIVIALLIVGIIATAILFLINHQRLQRLRARMLALQKDLKEIDEQITVTNQQTLTLNGTLKGLTNLQGGSPELNLITGLTANQKSDNEEHDYGSRKPNKKSFLPPIDIKKAKEVPMIIDPSNQSPNHNSNSKDFEYNYHSADKGGVAQIDTSMQSYSRTVIGRHLGSASKQGVKKNEIVHTGESSKDDKDDILTNGNGVGSNRVQEQHENPTA